MKIDIYGTLGPACRQQDTLEKMFACGMTGMRLNLSHTGLDQCRDWLDCYHRAAGQAGVRPKLLIDLQGPELRLGQVEPRELIAGTTVELIGDEQETHKDCGALDFRISENAAGHPVIPVPGMILDKLKPGQQILLDDGKLLLEVCGESSAFCRVLRGGWLKPRKSIALPGLNIHPPTLTDSDLANLKLAKALGVTGVMLPFVRDAKDLRTLRSALKEVGADHIRIFAKIENKDGQEKLPELLPYADEIVIARGDLGNSMPLWELPKAQYEIGNLCRQADKPYMVVTQMLASMEHAAVPTRAEVSDIFYAVLHGASSVMLTGETAAGEYPVEAMEYMCKTVESAMDIIAIYNIPHNPCYYKY